MRLIVRLFRQGSKNNIPQFADKRMRCLFLKRLIALIFSLKLKCHLIKVKIAGLYGYYNGKYMKPSE